MGSGDPRKQREWEERKRDREREHQPAARNHPSLRYNPQN
jgi:hypothetical protein